MTLKKGRDPKTGRFKKGYRGGPGRKPMHPDDKRIAKLNRTDIKVLINRFAHYNIDQLQDVLNDKTRTVLEHMVGRIFLIGIKEGDYRRMDAMLDRMIGKVREEKDININVTQLSDKELLEKAKEAQKVIEAEVIDDDI